MKYQCEFTSKDERLKNIDLDLCLSSVINLINMGFCVICLCLGVAVRNIYLIKIICLTFLILVLIRFFINILFDLIKKARCNKFYVEISDVGLCVTKNSKKYYFKLNEIVKCCETKDYYVLYVKKRILPILFKDCIEDEESFRKFVLNNTKVKTIINMKLRTQKFLKFVIIAFSISLILFAWFSIVLF